MPQVKRNTRSISNNNSSLWFGLSLSPLSLLTYALLLLSRSLALTHCDCTRACSAAFQQTPLGVWHWAYVMHAFSLLLLLACVSTTFVLFGIARALALVLCVRLRVCAFVCYAAFYAFPFISLSNCFWQLLLRCRCCSRCCCCCCCHGLLLLLLRARKKSITDVMFRAALLRWPTGPPRGPHWLTLLWFDSSLFGCAHTVSYRALFLDTRVCVLNTLLINAVKEGVKFRCFTISADLTLRSASLRMRKVFFIRF